KKASSASTSCWTKCSARKNADRAREENIDEKQWKPDGNYPDGPGSGPDPRLRRTASPGLRRLHQARAAQALVRTARMVAGSLRRRFESRRRLSLRTAWTGWKRYGDARRLSRDRAAGSFGPHGIVRRFPG